MSPENPKRMDAYIRVSRKGTREGASFQSPEQQRAAITGWAGARSHRVAVEGSPAEVEAAGVEPGLAA
jgi:hypothetical protein